MASSSVDEEEVTEEAISYYPYLLLAVSCAGIFSNVASLFVFARQRFRKMFHQLLVLLALYDFMVSISGNRYYVWHDMDFWKLQIMILQFVKISTP